MVFEWKYPIWANLVQKIKIAISSWNLVPTLIRACRIQCDVHSFCFWSEIPFSGKFGPKNQIGNVHFFCFLFEIPFLGKFVPKLQNSHLKLKFGTSSNSSMQNSMLMFIFLFLIGNPLFWQIWSKKSKLSVEAETSNWTNSNMQNSMMLLSFLVFEWKYPIWANLVQKIKIAISSWNLVPTLIRTCGIQWWYSFLLFLIGNTLFGQIWSKKSKLPVKVEIW